MSIEVIGQENEVNALLDVQVSLKDVTDRCAKVLPGWKMPAPLFLIPGATGKTSYLNALSTQLGSSRAVIAFRSPGIETGSVPLLSVQDMASHFLEEILLIQPQGPYLLAGHSFGGLVAYEIAQQLREIGEEVANLVLLDTACPRKAVSQDSEDPDVMAIHEISMIRTIFSVFTDLPVNAHLPDARLRRVYAANMAGLAAYRPRPLCASVTLLRARDIFPPGLLHPARGAWDNSDPGFGWTALCRQLSIVEVPGDHFTMLLSPRVEELGATLRAILGDGHAIPWRAGIITGVRGASLTAPVQVVGQEAILNCWNDAFLANPHPTLRRLQDEYPVCTNTCGHRWLTRYEDVSFVLKDPRFAAAKVRGHNNRSASQRPSVQFRLSKSSAALLNGFMLLADGEQHLRLKHQFAPFFRSVALQRWDARIIELVEDSISSMRQRAVADIIADVADPVPTGAIAEIMGFPRDDVPRLTLWARDVASLLDVSAFHDPALASTPLEVLQDQYEYSVRAFTAYVREHIERARLDRGDKGYLLHPQTLLDQGLGMDELVAQYVFIFLAGFVTTSNTIGNAMLALMRNPDQWALWRARPELTPSAVEEILRYDGGASCVLRFAREEVEIRGQRIGKGEGVVLSLKAANRDPRMFTDPDRLDITRDACRHLAFIQGTHSCLGAQLARMELRTVLPALIKLNFELVPDGIQWRQGTFFRGMTQLQVRVLPSSTF